MLRRIAMSYNDDFLDLFEFDKLLDLVHTYSEKSDLTYSEIIEILKLKKLDEISESLDYILKLFTDQNFF